jgi:hypothetical protein
MDVFWLGVQLAYVSSSFTEYVIRHLSPRLRQNTGRIPHLEGL